MAAKKTIVDRALARSPRIPDHPCDFAPCPGALRTDPGRRERREMRVERGSEATPKRPERETWWVKGERIETAQVS